MVAPALQAAGPQVETRHSRNAPGAWRQEASVRFWRIEPVADPSDSWWQGRPIWQLAVKATSAAEARIEAERWAQRNMPADRRVGNESPSNNAGFGDVRLYHVRPLPEAEGAQWLTNDPVAVLAGPLSPENAA
jgi:hypothetical protein